MRTAHLAGLLAVAWIAGACGELASQCTDEARASVQVKVVDSAGAIVRNAKVTFVANGGAPQNAFCPSGSDQDCAEWVAGYEVEGTIVVKATSADGTRQAEKTVTVGRDECHVITEFVTISLN